MIMENSICLKRADYINDRLCDVYKECFDEIIDVAKKNKIVKIVFDFHKEITDNPYLVFEHEHCDGRVITSEYEYERLSEMVFNESYNCITLIGEDGGCGYMDSGYGDYFNVQKIGEIFKSFMEIVGNDDLKPIEVE